MTNTNAGVNGITTAQIACDAAEVYVKSQEIIAFAGQSGITWFSDGSVANPWIAYVPNVVEPIAIGDTSIIQEDNTAVASTVSTMAAFAPFFHNFNLSHSLHLLSTDIQHTSEIMTPALWFTTCCATSKIPMMIFQVFVTSMTAIMVLKIHLKKIHVST